MESLSARRAWIEITWQVCVICRVESLSARRAWIEITYVTRLPRAQVVALRKESVDRNPVLVWKLTVYRMVALRKESVDRNLLCLPNS